MAYRFNNVENEKNTKKNKKQKKDLSEKLPVTVLAIEFIEASTTAVDAEREAAVDAVRFNREPSKRRKKKNIL